MEIYVGNLSYNTQEDQLMELFGAHGSVSQVKIVTDRETGRSRGFGFVSMANADEGRAAIEAMNGSEVDRRSLVVNEAREENQETTPIDHSVAVEIVIEIDKAAVATTNEVVETDVNSIELIEPAEVLDFCGLFSILPIEW